MDGPVPIVVDVAGRTVVCVGAGPVAAAKCRPFADAGARIVLVAPQVDAAFDEDDALIAAVAAAHRRQFRDDDLDPPVEESGTAPVLVIAATASTDVNAVVASAAAARGLWCIRVDGGGTAALPAVVRRGPLQVAVTSGGASPAFSAAVRQRLDGALDGPWAEVATLLGALRAEPEVRAALASLPQAERARRWRAAVAAVVPVSAAVPRADRAAALAALLDSATAVEDARP